MSILVYLLLAIIEGTQHTVAIQVKIVQTELIVEIYSKSPVRDIGKVLLMEFSNKNN